MNMQINTLSFGCQTTTPILNRKQFSKKLLGQNFIQADTFVRTTFDINKDLGKVRLKEKINEGSSAEVYSTNFEGYIIRLIKNTKFKPKALRVVNDPNGLTIAADNSDTMRLMKRVEGEPLYGKGWDMCETIPKEEYMTQFETIRQLPDDTFKEYIQNIIKIRENGYDIDYVNPNNYLLHNNHIGIVDLEMNSLDSNGSPIKDVYFSIHDFNPLINRPQLIRIIKMMSTKELHSFSEEIKKLYDRFINIASGEGYNLHLDETKDDGPANRDQLLSYLYYRNFKMLEKLISKE